MIYYFCFAILSVSLLWLNETFREKIFLYFLILCAFLFSALRYDAGYDYFSYLHLVTGEKPVAFDNLEIINRYLMLFARESGLPQLYFMITSFIYLLFMVLGFRCLNRLNSITLVMFIFFTGSYLTSFDIVRQMVAVSLVFYATARLVNKDYFISPFFALLAYGFHKSAIIFIPIYIFCVLFANRRYSLVFYFILFIGSIFSLDLVVWVLRSTDLYIVYVESGGNESGGKIYILVCFMVMALLLLSKTKDQTNFFWIYFNLFFVGFLIYTVFLPFGYFVTRVSYFLFPWAFVAWSELIDNSVENKEILKVFVYIFSVSIFFLSLYISSSSSREPYLNYSFYFFR